MRLLDLHGRRESNHSTTRNVMDKKKKGAVIILCLCIVVLVACQANYISDVNGGTIAPSSSPSITIPVSK